MIEKEVDVLENSNVLAESEIKEFMDNLNLSHWKSIKKFAPLYQSSGVYSLVFPEEKAIYVGKTKYFYRRLTQHFTDLSNGYHWNSRVAHMVGKTQKFPKVAILEDTIDFDKRERFWMTKFEENGWNMLNLR